MKTRRWLAALSAVLVAAALMGQLWAAAADGALDLSRECTLTVKPCDDTEANKEMAEELSAVDIVIDLYRVADMTADGTAYGFATVSPFDELAIPGDITNDGWIETAQQAAGMVLLPDVRDPSMAGVSAGSAVKLQSGLYLLVAHERGDSDYVKTITDEDGRTSIVTQIKTDKHLYTFAPELVSLPSKLPEDGAINTANKGDWIYDLTVSLKPERSELKGQLEIVKKLLTYETSAPATFVFQLDWDEDGRHYSDVRTITFTAPGERVLLVEDLPVGATVTVTEVYSGAVYTIVGDREQTAIIEADETARVEFVNDYDEDSPPNGGGAITNRFTYDDGWKLDRPIDSTDEYSVTE